MRLPWGLELKVRATDALGHVVVRTGVYDAAVSETLFRLADPGDLAVDVGASVGYMTSLLAVRVGRSGKVACFEPQPDVREELEANVIRWRRQGMTTAIDVRGQALSDSSGWARLSRPSPTENRGGASLESAAVDQSDDPYEVPVVRLDELFAPETTLIGVMKIDVERHELQVLQGSDALLRCRAIRDIVFEEHRAYPNPVTDYLERNGYSLFKLDHTLLGPWIGPPDSPRRVMADPSYLATIDRQRALHRLHKRGWQILRRPTALARV